MRKIIVLLFLVFISTKIFSKPVGLENCGNTCFQNAFIQMIYQIDPLIDILSKRQDLYPQDSLGYTFQHLAWDIMNAQKTNQPFIGCGSQGNPTNLKKLTEGIYSCLGIGAGSQGDLSFGFTNLMQELKKETSDPNLVSILDMIKESTFYPSGAKPYTAPRLIPVVPFVLLDHFGDTPNLQHYIDKAFVTKKESWFDPVTKTIHENVSVKYKLLSAPSFIGFIYKASPEQGFEPLKNTIFHDELKFTRYIKGNVPTFYQLRAIGVHVPSGAGGHYFAVVRDRDGKLYNCNDRTITQVTSWKEGIGTHNPAVFLYVLKTTKQDPSDSANLIHKLNNLQQGLQNLERFLVSI